MIENENVNQESPEVFSPEITQDVPVSGPTPEEVQAKSDAAKNMRALREKSERIERERDEALKKLQELQYGKHHSHDHDDDEIKIGPDELAEGKHVTQVDRKIKKLEQQLQSYQQSTNATTAEARLKAQYPDFDRVVSKDNIDLLKETEPEIAYTINASSDIYSKAVSAYKMIKKLGIYQEDPYIKDRERAEHNAAKPRPLASVSPQQGDSPLSKANAFANGLTDDLKKQLYKEMVEARRSM